MGNRTFSVFCLSEALSPITHAAGTEGNESVIMREPVATEHGVKWVPCLSGNALRHRMVREPGGRWLIDTLGLRGELDFERLNFFLHGGNLTESTGVDDTRRLADLHRLYPLLRLIGGSLPDQITSGSLTVWRGMLVCRENRNRLPQILPAGWELPDLAMLPADAFVSGVQYTRADARKTAPELAASSDLDLSPSSLMIFSGQAVTAGALFVHGFHLRHVGEPELAALVLSLSRWAEEGGTIGGQQARGHGRLKLEYAISPDVDVEAAVSAYQAHTLRVRDEARAWLSDAFTRKPKADKSRKGTKKKEEPSAPAEGDGFPG